MQLPLIRKVETSITNIENYFTQQRRANGQDDKQIKAAQGMLDILKMRYWQLIEEQNTAADELKEQFETTINTLNNIIQDLYVSIIITGNETEEYLERQATANQNLANYIKDFPVINDKDQLATLSHELRYQTAVKRLAQHKMNADDPKTNLVRGLVKESNYLKKTATPEKREELTTLLSTTYEAIRFPENNSKIAKLQQAGEAIGKNFKYAKAFQIAMGICCLLTFALLLNATLVSCGAAAPLAMCVGFLTVTSLFPVIAVAVGVHKHSFFKKERSNETINNTSDELALTLEAEKLQQAAA